MRHFLTITRGSLYATSHKILLLNTTHRLTWEVWIICSCEEVTFVDGQICRSCDLDWLHTKAVAKGGHVLQKDHCVGALSLLGDARSRVALLAAPLQACGDEH